MTATEIEHLRNLASQLCVELNKIGAPRTISARASGVLLAIDYIDRKTGTNGRT